MLFFSFFSERQMKETLTELQKLAQTSGLFVKDATELHYGKCRIQHFKETEDILTFCCLNWDNFPVLCKSL